MLETSESKESELITNEEFRTRSAQFFMKHGKLLADFVKMINEGKISWGTLVEKNAEEYANKIAIKFEEQTFTYKEFNEWVNRYAHFFISTGIEKGDVIELMMTNRPEYLIIITALGKIGAISSLINIDLRESSLINSLKLTPGKMIIVGENCFNKFYNVKTELGLSQDQNLCFLPDKGFLTTPENFIDLEQKISDFPIENPYSTLNVKMSDIITYIFTSGTTGFPKATKFAHATLITGYYSFGKILLELTPEDTMYVTLPLFHSNSLGAGWAAAFGGGSTLALGRKFSVSRFWDETRKYNATVFNYIGELCRYLINQPPKPNDSDNPVKKIIGAGLRPEIWMDFKRRFNIDKIKEYYSSTEAVSGFANLLDFDCTVGYCMSPYAIVKYDHEVENPLKNEQGYMQRVKPGENGLLLFEIAGTAVFRGYTDKKATESKIFHNVFKEGDKWFNTGDLMKDL
ncbi:MAG: AMP-binding protein, partial [Candidatus Thorarchaeota archaeon]